MAHLTSTEQARLEQLLARAHQTMFHLATLYSARDDYTTTDDLSHIQSMLFDLLERELEKGKRLRTR